MIAGGYGANAINNYVTIDYTNSPNAVISGGTAAIGDAYETVVGNATGNYVEFINGSAWAIKGGDVTGGSGNANGNTVIVHGGTISDTVIGGQVQDSQAGKVGGTGGTGTANGNVVTLAGGTIKGGVSGGQAIGNNAATHNRIEITGTVTVGGAPGENGAIFGGHNNYYLSDNHSDVVRGNTLTIRQGATLTMTGDGKRNISNFETITVHGNITGAGFIDLDNGNNVIASTLNLHGGTVSTDRLATSAKSTVNFNGGNLYLNSGASSGTNPAQGALQGNYNFNLNEYKSVINGGNTAIVIATATASVADNAKFDIDGGNYGERYHLFNNVAANAASKIKDNDFLTYGAVMDGAQLCVTPDVNDAGTRRAAENASSANTAIAGAISAMERNHSTPADVRAALVATAKRRDGSFGRLITELNNTNSASATTQLARSATYQFNAALGQLFGDTFAAGLASDDIYTPSRFFDETHAAAGGSPVAKKQMTGFIKGYGGFGSQGSGKAVGYEFDGLGLLAGLGYNFSRELQAGALLGYSYNHAELYHGFGWAVDNVLRLGLYGNYNWDKFFFNTAPTLGVHFIDTRRQIGEMGVTAKNERTGVDFSWYNRAGYTFALPQDFYLTPSASLSLSYLHNPAYSESGANGANLRVDAYNNWSLLQTLDLRAGKKFQVGESFAVLPEIWAGWEHEYIDSNDMRVGFAGNNQQWDAPVADIGANRLLLGLGLTTLIRDKYEVFARYDERLWGDGHASQFTVGANAKF
ncbi:hypothetical protein AGMMS49959_06400 [Planctomycetales bacterium]|nr:hypothetical protein AGMMS49959_06400 [Planctomycetales bacterium]